MKSSNSLSKSLSIFLTTALTFGLSANLACLAQSFQFDLYKNIAKSKASSNLLVSPLSVEMAMTMTSLGAEGTTFDEMSKALDLELKSDQSNSNSPKLKDDFMSLNEKDADSTLKIVNNLFGNKEIKFNKDFLDSTKSQFGAELTSLDFSKNDSLQQINKWVKEKSGGKISQILNKIEPSASLYLINAVYFKSAWAEQFEPDQTSEKSFHTANEQMVKVPMMVAERKKFSYFQDRKFQALRLHYKNGRYSMLFFLPNEHSSLEELEKQLNETNWQQWLERFQENPGKITLPKFKIEDNMKLKSALCTIGISHAFDSQSANFSKMIDKNSKTELFLSQVFHKTFIDVNEEGTEASASTAAEASSKTLDFASQYFEMKLNHPFLFSLYDQKTNRILFLGHVTDPSQK